MKLDDMLERDWQKQVVELAALMGWNRPMHIHDSRKSEPGWPDLALVRDRLILVELKREHGTTSPAQKKWLGLLHHANVEVYVARPRHFQALSHVLHARGPVHTWTGDQLEARGVLLLELDIHLRKAAG